MSNSELVANAASIDPPDEAARPRRRHVSLLIGSGIIASAQIDKAVSLPLIRNDLALGLDLASRDGQTHGAKQ